MTWDAGSPPVGADRGACGGQHAQRINREVADRDRHGDDAAWRYRRERGGERLHAEQGFARGAGGEQVGGEVDEVVAGWGDRARPGRVRRERVTAGSAGKGRRGAEAVRQGVRAAAVPVRSTVTSRRRGGALRRCGSRRRRRRAGRADGAAGCRAGRRAGRVRRPGPGAAGVSVCFRERGDALAVAVQAVAARRGAEAQHGRVVGHVGVESLGKVIEH